MSYSSLPPGLALLLGVLAVWRITHLLAAEDGPWDLIVRLRRAAGEGFWGGLLDCFYCLSLWVALPAACLLADGWRLRALLWPALSGAAILAERLTHPRAGTPPALFSEDAEDTEDQEVPDVLRQTETGLE
jgi:hypothetical protein